MSVRFGEHTISTEIDCQHSDYEGEPDVCAEKVQDIPVEKIIIHEGYGVGIGLPDDIVLIRLFTAVVFTSNYNKRNCWNLFKFFNYLGNIIPICLPFNLKLSEKTYNESLTVIGFGYTEKEKKLSDILQFGLLQITEKCKEIYPDVNLDLDKQFCAGGKGEKN